MTLPVTDEAVASWGRLAKPRHRVVRPGFADEAREAVATQGEFLGFGLGRSYGDVCLDSGRTLIASTGLDRLIVADWSNGIVRAEAGLSLDALLRLAVPRGWFPPVVPGTKFVTLAGAVANDIHGKNHETAGTFGRHVRGIGLLRSSGELIETGPDTRPDLFAATIGGLGLTGLILWVELALSRIASDTMETEALALDGLDAFFRIADDSASWPYTVAWVDCLASGRALGRGFFLRARHSTQAASRTAHRRPKLAVPLDAPSWLLNGATVRAFNTGYRLRPGALGRRAQHYDSFFFPLDAVAGWNRLYGPRGFFQHQSVVPDAAAPQALRRLLELTARFRQGSFLVVLKRFGDVRSPGLLSFPMAGATLALDFPNRGDITRRVLDLMTEAVLEAGGRLYPAKDATMSGDAFRAGYPRWREVEALRDPNVNSDFWRRVTA